MQVQAPWGPLELRVFFTKFRHALMSQQAWSELHLTIKEIVQNEVEMDDADADDLAAIEAKKMWWNGKLECGVVELYSQQALDWYRRTINTSGRNVRAWSNLEKPEPRLKVWIKPQFAHLTPEKIHLTVS